MSYILDLSSARAKLERAKEHVETLRSDVGVEGSDNAVAIPLRQQFELEQGAIVFRIERVIEIRDYWSLILGDAAHNLRCALDHLAWQLAIRHNNGIVPTDYSHIRGVQFPIVIKKNDWPTDRYRKFMEPSDAAKLERFQPFNLGPISRARGDIHPLEALAGFGGLDNIDKHRTIHIVSHGLYKGTLGGRHMVFADCWFVPGPGGMPIWKVTSPSDPPNPGDEVLRIDVTPTGPNPKVDFNASLTGYVTIRETWNVFTALDAMKQGVEDILNEF